MPVKKVDMKKPAASRARATKAKHGKPRQDEVEQIIPEKTTYKDMILVLHGQPLDDTFGVPYLQHSSHYPVYVTHFILYQLYHHDVNSTMDYGL